MLDAVQGFLGQIIYPLFSVIFTIIDVLQSIFGAFAGIDAIKYNGEIITSGNTGEGNDTGIVYYLLTSDVILNMFYSMLALAVILLLIFLTMAFIKNVYSAKPKSWKDIVGSAIKGIGNFVIIPVACLLGIWLGNIVLQAINGATSQGGNISISRQLFICSAYNANKIRNGEISIYDGDNLDVSKIESFCAQYGISVDTSQTDPEYYANCIDQAYNTDLVAITWWEQVDEWYNLSEINYLILGAGGIFILYALGSISFGMVKRLFMLLVLFIISPIVCSMYPLDDGSAAGSWRKKFLSQTISAYAAVAGLNLFFSIVPIVQNIELNEDVLGITALLLVIAGLYMVRDIISLVAGFIGGDDAYSGGTSLMNSVKTRARNGQKHATAMSKTTVGAFAKAAATKKAGGSFFKSIGGSITGGILGKKDDKGNRTGGLLQKATSKLFIPDFQSSVNEYRDQKRSSSNESEGKKQHALKILNSLSENGKGEIVGDVYDAAGKKKYHPDAAGRSDIFHRIADSKVYSGKEIAKLAKTAGIEDEVQELVAKAHGGKAKEDLDTDKELAKSVVEARKSFDDANVKFGQMLNQATLKVQGLDVAGMSVSEFDALQSRMKNGELYSGDDLSVDSVFERMRKESEERTGHKLDSDAAHLDALRVAAKEDVSHKQAENRAVEQFQAQKENVESMADALIKAMQKYDKDSKTDFVSIDSTSIDNFKKGLEEALDKNQVVETTAIDKATENVSKIKETIEKEIVKTIRDSSKEIVKTLQEKKEKGNIK